MNNIIKEELNKLSGVERIIAVPIYYLTYIAGYLHGCVQDIKAGYRGE